MEITGRLVADATVRNTNNGKQVTGFRLAINRNYISNGEKVQDTTFVDCSYWRTTAIAPYLTKGMVVQLYGYMSASAWLDRDGNLRAGLNFHVNEMTPLTASNRQAEQKQPQQKPLQNTRANSTSRVRSNKPNAGLKPSTQFN
ncbi:MAG: single-stranded DNA-binding protein [Mucilaginibacter sp.]